MTGWQLCSSLPRLRYFYKILFLGQNTVFSLSEFCFWFLKVASLHLVSLSNVDGKDFLIACSPCGLWCRPHVCIGGGGGGHSNYFLMGVCLTKLWNGGLKSWLQAQIIGSLELQKPWNVSLVGSKERTKTTKYTDFGATCVPKTYGNSQIGKLFPLFWIWGCKARLELYS